jgi:DNA gyrase subunit A
MATSSVREILSINIEDELKQSYLDYAMSVIVGRALPDVRDGLKPVHRRVLFAMRELNNDFNKPYKKSARVVGDVIGKYHPHGDGAVYDTIVRMAQPFSMRYLLVDGQGNFGSVDGDPAAAMRYTEVRMTPLSHALLSDLDKETVDFVPNYDGAEFCPVVLPARVPNLLINGSSGIAVGMATNIPTHNIGEVIDACQALLRRPEMTVDELMAFVKGPDFPTAGIIVGHAGIIEAYRTGRGRIVIRARTHVEVDEKNGRQSIVVTELPYQVNKARLVEKIAELTKEKRVEGIVGLRDESDKDGMRVVVDVRRGDLADVILNQLFAYTQMQTVYGINMVALMDGRPQTFHLKGLLDAFLRHRREVITRRTVFELRKARERVHILEGLSVALASIDEMITLIKTSANRDVAKERMMAQVWALGSMAALLSAATAEISRPQDLLPEYGMTPSGEYRLSVVQAQAILDLRLHRLTGLEHDKITQEYQDLWVQIQGFLDILHSQARLLDVVAQELTEMRAAFVDARRTEIQPSEGEFNIEDLISPEEVVVTLSHRGYVKYQSLDVYQTQKRGGKGKSATVVHDEDFIDTLLVANTHDTLLCFSSIGKVYWLKVHQLPQASRMARGRPIINVLPLAMDEKINAILNFKPTALEEDRDHYVVMATEQGLIKKTGLSEFSRPRNSGIIAIDLVQGDRLIGVLLTEGASDILLFSDAGKVVRFNESGVRPMGRTARGVQGIKLGAGQAVISLMCIAPGTSGAVLTVTENGYGKRTPLDQYPAQNRAGQGVISIQISTRNGKVIGAIRVGSEDQVMLISDQGTLVRIPVEGVSEIGRNTQGVTLIHLSDGEHLASLARVAE